MNINDGLKVLLESESKQLLDSVGIPTTKLVEASSEEEAIEMSDDIGYPVVLKVHSRLIPHKSDSGGVFLDLRNPNQVRKAYRSILMAAKAYDLGANVSVQKMVEPGVEMIVGTTTDPHFGPILVVGFGGIFVELLNDTTFGLIPLKEHDAVRMIRVLKGFPLLEGYRGQHGTSIDAISAIMLKVSDLVWREQEIVEMDLNPVIVHEGSATVVDARTIIRENGDETTGLFPRIQSLC